MNLRHVADIDKERQAQDRQWGGSSHDDQHDGDDWTRFIQKQTSAARKALQTTTEASEKEYRSRLVKIAALAVAALESYDRQHDPF